MTEPKPHLIFIHGFGADRLSWLGNIGEFESGYTTHNLEIPGHGQAEVTEAAQSHSLAQLSEELLAPVVTSPTEPVHLVGHSLGGGLALLYAAKHPRQVQSITLVAPVGLGQGVDTAFTTQFAQLTDADAAMALLQSLVFNPKLISNQLVPPLLQHIAQPGVRDTLTRLADLLDATTRVHDQAQQLTAAKSAVIDAKINRQVIWGLGDNTNVPNAEDETTFGGDWHWFDDCRHLPHIEHRVKFNRLLQAWLTKHAQPTA